MVVLKFFIWAIGLVANAGVHAEPMSFSISCFANTAESCFLSAEGEITKDSPEAFKLVAEGGAFDGGQVLFNSPGGNLAAGFELGRLIREYGLFTVVGVKQKNSFPTAGRCESACAYAFLGGTKRTLVSGSRVGFHQFSLNKKASDAVGKVATVMAGSQKLSATAISYLVEMDIDARLFALASGADPDEMFYPSQEVAEKYNVISPRGYAPFFMEPYGKGVVAASKRKTPTRAYDSVYQVTTFCSKRNAKLLFTSKGFAPDRSAEFYLKVDSGEFAIPPNRVVTRTNSKNGFLEVTLTEQESWALQETTNLSTYFNYSRAEGWQYSTLLQLNDLDRKMIETSFRLCL